MAALIQDLCFGFRMLRRAPGFTAVAVLSLALGIGANATVLCWIQGILHHPLAGVKGDQSIVVVTSNHGDEEWDTVSMPDLRDQARLKNVFSGVIGSTELSACVSFGDRSEWICGQLVTANFFEVLGVMPILGRGFLAEEDRDPGGHPVLVISEDYWRRRFGADSGVIGRAVILNRHSFTIIGVAPSAFRGTMNGLRCDYWAPVVMRRTLTGSPDSLEVRGDRWLHAHARLQPGVKLTQAQLALDILAPQLEGAYPDSNREIRFRALPLWKCPYGGQNLMLPVLSLLLAASLGVLLLVSVNVANLLLARSTGRRGEVAIRLALGAGRGRLIGQLLTEYLMLALLGGGLGLLLAHWMAGFIRCFLPVSFVPLGFSLTMDGGTLGLVLLLTLATGLIFGLVPALQASRPDLSEALKESGRSSGSGAAHHRLLRLFVVTQIALALVLLVSAGLCLKGLQEAQRVDKGFNSDHLLFSGLSIGMNGYDEARGKLFFRELQRRVAAQPGVRDVALSSWYPLGIAGGGTWGVEVDGYDRKPNEDTDILRSAISPRYFATLQIPLLEGRDFSEQDDENAPKVAIINEAMAQRFWPGQSALGRSFRAGGASRTIVGIAKTGKYSRLNEHPKGFFYTPFRQGLPELRLDLAIRTVGAPMAFAGTLRQEIRKLDPDVESWGTLSMDDFISGSFSQQRIVSSLLLLLGAVAVLLAAMGVYGVMAYAVAQRRQEFGIRAALGATPSAILSLILREGLLLASVGAGAGLFMALAMTRLMGRFLYGVSPSDPVIFAGVISFLVLATLLACAWPAHRASRMNPVDTLRAT